MINYWERVKPALKNQYKRLSEHLGVRGKEICTDNECTEDDHNCESYAYINIEGELLDICMSDYFQGSSKPYAAIPMPFQHDGTGEALFDAVSDDIAEQTAQ